MAKDTDKKLRQNIIYSVYVRSHTTEGTFNAIVDDLDRIKSLGVDIIWFMPIHPCGQEKKKGSVGSPYAIQHYREVNPEYGTKKDFIALVDEIHKRDMKCMIDVVYNHTSPDAWLVQHHPEFYYRKPDGSFGNKTADWEDVIDLDFSNKGLWDYHIESLKMWARLIDGFRCDVASLVPLDFWLRAREEVAHVKPGFIWLAETVEDSFIKLNRQKGFTALSDGETYQAFDITYDYDVINCLRDYIEGKGSLAQYINMLNLQDILYPENYVKLRFLENHDRPRVKSFVPNESDLLNWTAFLYFQKGATLLYAGQETQNTLKPSLFEIEKIDWHTGKDIGKYLKSLYNIKQEPLMSTGDYTLRKDEKSDVIVGFYNDGVEKIVGIFPVKSQHGNMRLDEISDGEYTDMIDKSKIHVCNGNAYIEGKALIFKAS